jgi:hypothetical protein
MDLADPKLDEVEDNAGVTLKRYVCPTDTGRVFVMYASHITKAEYLLTEHLKKHEPNTFVLLDELREETEEEGREWERRACDSVHEWQTGKETKSSV